nr:ALPV-219 [Albatrosspox virus]
MILDKYVYSDNILYLLYDGIISPCDINSFNLLIYRVL